LAWLRSMVIASDADRHAAGPAPLPEEGFDDGAEDGTVAGGDGTVAGEDGAADGVLAGVVALGAVAAGADVGAAGCPVVAIGCAPSAGWLALGEAQATSTDDAATTAPASNAALGNVNDALENDLDMGVNPSVLSLRVSTVSLIRRRAASNLSSP
jgi:hypothetical protein